jgi:hypothetical protein
VLLELDDEDMLDLDVRIGLLVLLVIVLIDDIE